MLGKNRYKRNRMHILRIPVIIVIDSKTLPQVALFVSVIQ